MQQATSDVIDTLSHRDFVHIQYTTGPNPQFSDSFVRSDQTTRVQLQSFIQEHKYTPGAANLDTIFSNAYQTFEEAYGTNVSSDCIQAVIFLSDSELDENLVTTIRQLRENLEFMIDIFTYTFGGLDLDPTTAQEIACDNGGEWFQIRDQSQVDDNIHSYYKFYAAAVQNSGVVWSEYFQDVFTSRDLIAACLPVYDPMTIELAPQLLGVTCVNVDPARFGDFPDGMEVSS